MNIKKIRSVAGHSFRIVGGLSIFALGMLNSSTLLAAGTESEPARIYSIGVFAHDTGPMSDNHEHGTDLNLEVKFAPIPKLWSARPHLGATINFIGDTSVVYAGLSFPFYHSQHLFLDGILGAAVHDGPMHKDPAGCREESDCGFGKRMLPRFGLEAGYHFSANQSISVLFDHMSHKWIMNGENEGVDHVGLRYQVAF